jgi:hypothetical protein
MPASRNGSNRGYKPLRVALAAKDSARAREIAEHNAAVERRKAEKKARKLVQCKALRRAEIADRIRARDEA